MAFSHVLREHIAAGFSGVWIESHEHEDAVADITRLCREEGWSLATWDVDRGMALSAGQPPGEPPSEPPSSPQVHDPVAATRSAKALASPDGAGLLVLPNFHRFMQSAEVVQALWHAIHDGRRDRTFIVVLSALVTIPKELEREFVVIPHDLPARDEIDAIARGVATEEGELPVGDELDRVLDAAAGLTRLEAENAVSLSLVRHGRVTPDTIWELKTQTLKKSGLLTLHRGGESFGDLGGLEALKAFCLRALDGSRATSTVRPRGVMLLGVPGTGKSAFAKALGNEVGRPTLMMDVGALMGSLVGQTEANVRQALRIVDAMAPCVLFIDEIEKALAGAASSGATDSGVSARLFGSFLTWLSDHESDVFVVCTSNDVSKLPPEFTRAERFDAVVFLDLPSTAEKQVIWNQYLRSYNLDADQPKPKDKDWTGAEIRACCRLAALLGQPLREAAQNVVPVAVTASESVDRLRKWASGRCLAASIGGIFQTSLEADKPKRRVSRNPSNN